MVFQYRQQNLVVWPDILPAPTLRDEINGLGCAADEDDFVYRGSVEKSTHFLTRLFVGIGGACGQLMRRAMNVGVFVFVKILQPVDHRLRLLGGRGVV